MHLTQPLHQALQASPEAPLTVFGTRIRSVREVADRVARLAAGLRSVGVQAGDRVAMLALNSDRYFEYLLAVPWADAVINPVNIRWSAAEIAYSFRDSETAVLFIDDAYVAMLPQLRDSYPGGLRTVVYCGDGEPPEGTVGYEDLIAAHAPVADARRGGDEVAGIFYTGGTTGFPKGVTLTHRNMMTQYYGILASRCYLRSGSVYLHAAPMFHLADLAGWGAQLVLGGPHVIIPSFDPVRTLEAVQEHRVTDALLVPTMVQLLVDHPAIDEYDTGSLETVLYAGSPMAPALLDRAMVRFAGTTFIQGYGMTELAAACTMLRADLDRASDAFRRSAGRALPHNEVMIVDPDDNEVPRGTVGEVVVRGGNVMAGYWNNPEATAAVLRDGWMHTGDGAYMDESGYIYIVDRLKDMIVTGGENVYSAEVENAVATHPDVLACAVIGIPDADWGERVHAVVVARPGSTIDAAAVRQHVRGLIAAYKAPRSVDFVDALPTTGAGKVLKRSLREAHWSAAERQVN